MAQKVKSGKWRSQITIGTKIAGINKGMADRASRYFDTEKEAVKWEAEQIRIKEILDGKSNRVTLDDYIDHFYLPSKQHLRPSSLNGYKSHIDKYLRPAFGSHLLSSIRHSDIQKMLNTCRTRKIATNARDMLRGILQSAMDDEIITSNPAKGKFVFPVEIEDTETKSIKAVWLTRISQHVEILEFAQGDESRKQSRAYILLLLGLCLGLRKGEILGLNWEHVDFKNRFVKVRQTYTVGNAGEGAKLFPPKTKKSKREIPMSDFLHERLEAYRSISGSTTPKGPLVTSTPGTRMSPKLAQNIMERFSVEYGTKITLFSLRHSFATASLNAGMKIWDLSRILGHESIDTTWKRYVKPNFDDLKDGVKFLDDAYNPKKDGAGMVQP